jgi:hypothetical protein
VAKHYTSIRKRLPGEGGREGGREGTNCFERLEQNNGHLKFEFHIALHMAYFKPFVVTNGSDYQNWGLAIFRTLLGILIL